MRTKVTETTPTKIKNTKEFPYVIIRTYSAGIFAGNLQELRGNKATILNARRLWYWEGAATLSQLAQSGTVKPMKCKFPEEVSKILLTEVIEILYVSADAEKSIKGVPIWKI
jgi:hypothetical protein